MDSLQTTRSAVETAIRSAFAGVTLGRGTSIRQAELLGGIGDISAEAYDALPRDEVTDDWARIPDEELERACVGYFDPEGFRYYIPALALSVLRHYDGLSLRTIGTLSVLYPKRENRDYHLGMYSLLSRRQKRALALYLARLPELVPLGYEHPQVVSRALGNYWQEFLDESE